MNAGVVGRHRLDEFPDVVDDDGAGQPLQHFLARRELAAVELHDGVPAQALDARGERRHHLPFQEAAGEEKEPQAADAGRMQPLELGVGDAVVGHRDAARVRAHHLHRRDGAAIVLAVGGGLHHDGVRDAQILAHLQVFGSRRVVRLGDRSRRDRIARLVDVHMHVPSAGGRFQTRGGLVFRGAHGACVTTGSRGDNLNLAAWNEIINALRRARRGAARRPRRRGLRASPGSSAPHRPAAARRTCGRGPRARG